MMSRGRWPPLPPLRADPAIPVGLALVALALLAAGWFEASLPRHLLGQYALLVAGGALIGAAAGPGRGAGLAPALLLAAVLTLAFWLLPRWIDAAVASARVDAAKTASLILLAGMPLGAGWRRAGPVLRGFFWTQAAMMLAVMGWLLLAVPQRLCNAYLASDQALLGRALLVLAAAMVLGGVLRLLAGPGAARDWRRPLARYLFPGAE